MKTLPVMDIVWIHQQTGNVVLGCPADHEDVRFAPIEIINVCAWIDAMGYDYLTKYSVTVEGLEKYLAEHTDTTYWSAPREDFFHSTAALAAYAGGFTKVIVEDLS